ncbi:MAG: hypothetical protein ACLTFB_02395 [Candidatus Phytoplasma pyri]|uniref:hypothetical protein n=1 Tax=Candidatus Phytoplasma pyri TaxID=47566 RepID=UPI0039833841
MILNKFKKIYFINLFLTLIIFIFTNFKFFCPQLLDIVNFYLKLLFSLTWTFNDVIINRRCDELKQKYMFLDSKRIFLKRYLISWGLFLLGFIFSIKIFYYSQVNNFNLKFITKIINFNLNLNNIIFLISILLVLLMLLTSLLLYMYNKLKIFIFLDYLEKKETLKIFNQDNDIIFSEFKKRHFFVVKMYFLTFFIFPFLFLFIIIFVNYNLIFNSLFLKFYYLILTLPLLIGNLFSWINFYKLAVRLDKI